jgi:hypothetical protein
MKRNLLFILILASLVIKSPVNAQSRFATEANEIAGLETYLKSIKTVYSTTSKGLNDINNLKSGSFSLNQSYFSSLKNVSPAVRNDPKIKAISDLQQQIQTTFNNALSWQQSKGQLSSGEISYMKTVYNNLLGECNKDLQELTVVITNGQAQMTDKARIEKIDSIYKDMQDKSSFSQSFTGKAYVLANARIADKNGDQSIKTLYNVN